MRCDDLDDLIEELSAGEPVNAEAEAHLATCAACRARVELARAVDRLLLAREVPAPPERFTLQVLRRVSQERWRVEQFVEALSAAGCRPAVVSGGSTPALYSSHLVTGTTEIRPGTYIYNDRTTAEVGACAPEDCALTILATVVSTAVPGQAVIDAGTKALGREPMRGADASGYGALLDHPDVSVKAMSEEHGMLDVSRTGWKPAVGDRVRVVPNHVCVSVHLHEAVYAIRGDRVLDRWPVTARGREPVAFAD